MPTADQVADWFIAVANERGEELNNQKLQRVLYYAQAWHLGQFGTPLFEEKISASPWGPFVLSIWRRFLPEGIGNIPARGVKPTFDERTTAFLEEIAARYLPVDEFVLGDMACSEAPWLNARRGVDELEISPHAIPEAEMRILFHAHAEAA